MSEIRVTFAALEAARTDVAGTATRISGRLDDLRRAVTPLVATWEGQAADEYRHPAAPVGHRGRRPRPCARRHRAGAGRRRGRLRATERANTALWRA